MATGVSIVIHPISPLVPIIHMNIRYFEMSNGTYWFGGGIDLSPHYIDTDDAQYFHRQLKDLCDSYHPDYYPRFKTWADDYFYIPHREETRGVGGIFFDRLMADADMPFPKLLSFVEEVGYLFPKIYRYFMNKHSAKPYGEKELQWQALRRGRYVEFNLVWDAGTKFGLDTNGRTEKHPHEYAPPGTLGIQSNPRTRISRGPYPRPAQERCGLDKRSEMIEQIKDWDEALFLFLNQLHLPWLDPIMLALTGRFIWIPLYLYLLYLIIKTYKKDSIWYILGLVLVIILADQLTSSIMKPFF